MNEIPFKMVTFFTQFFLIVLIFVKTTNSNGIC